MSNPTGFGTQAIGQTEKALNAILDRRLSGTGLTEPQWVSLTLAVVSSGQLNRPRLTGRVAGALHVSETDAASLLDSLTAAGLLGTGTAEPTSSGRELHARIRTEVGEITERLWGDLPEQDLETAGRVLATVLERANRELAR